MFAASIVWVVAMAEAPVAPAEAPPLGAPVVLTWTDVPAAVSGSDVKTAVRTLVQKSVWTNPVATRALADWNGEMNTLAARLREASALGSQDLTGILATLTGPRPSCEQAAPGDNPAMSMNMGGAAGLGGSSATLESLLIAGLLTFVEKRAQEEALRYVIDQLRQKVCGVPGGSDLLPRTCGLTAQLASPSAPVSPLIMLRQAIVTDLRALPANLGRSLPETDAWRNLRCGLFTAEAVRAAAHEGRSAAAIGQVILASSRTQDCAAFLRNAGVAAPNEQTRLLLDVLLAVLGDLEKGAGEERLDDLESVVLAKLKAAAAELPTPADYTSAMGGLQDTVEKVHDILKCEPATLPAGARERLRVLAERLEGSRKDGAAAYRASRKILVDQVLTTLAPLESLLRRASPPGVELGRALLLLRDSKDAQSRAALGRAVLGHALLWAARLFTLQADATAAKEASPHLQKFEAVLTATQKLSEGAFAEGLTLLLSAGWIAADVEPYATLLRFSELFVGLAEAKTSDEVAALIEQAAVPAGSWKRKRRQIVFGVSAQFGIAGLGETAWVGDVASYGLGLQAYVPVGVEVAWPTGGGAWAMGLMAQILDLGAVSSVRVMGDTLGDTKVAPEARLAFSSVLAPGLALYLGLGDSPFVLNASASYVPGLRQLRDGEGRSGALRYGLALTVDVPIFLY